MTATANSVAPPALIAATTPATRLARRAIHHPASSGLLRALDPRQRDVLLADEKAHLLHHHAWWNLAAGLTAAVNPVLRPAARAAATAVTAVGALPAAAVQHTRERPVEHAERPVAGQHT